MIELMAMQALPPVPSWSELHPLIIHFPIALLLVVPLFVAGAIILDPQKGRPFLVAAFSLMVLGTLGTVFAVATGEAAAEVAHRSLAASAVLERHQELAETTRDIFALLTVIFAALLFLPRYFKKETTLAAARILPIAFLVFYVAGTVVLINTAHHGGRLVHEFGVHSIVQPTNEAVNGVMPENVAARDSESER